MRPDHEADSGHQATYHYQGEDRSTNEADPVTQTSNMLGRMRDVENNKDFPSHGAKNMPSELRQFVPYKNKL